MKYFKIAITLSSGKVIEKTTSNPTKVLNDISLEFPQRLEYQMLEILGLTSLVKGYVVTSKVEPL